MVYEKEHFEDISIVHKQRKRNEVIRKRKLTIKWAIDIDDFEFQIGHRKYRLEILDK